MVPGSVSIARGRAGFARFLTDSIEILRRTDTPDGAGGVNVAETVVATVAGRIVAETTPQEPMQGGRLAGVVTYTAFLTLGTDVRPADVLRRGADRFEVLDDTSAETDGLATVVTVRRAR